MRDLHAAQDHRIARSEAMHVVAGRDTDVAGRTRALASQHLVGHAQILRRGELPVLLRAFDQGDVEPEPFGDPGVVGELAPALR